MNKKPKLGQLVYASDCLYKHRDHDGKCTWIRNGSKSWSRPKPVQGVYMGSRTKQNGYTDWDGDATYWVKTGQVEVWLIVVSDRTNPIFVSPEDCTYDKPT